MNISQPYYRDLEYGEGSLIDGIGIRNLLAAVKTARRFSNQVMI
nr:MAG TPA: hypothetical protein [Caudoviricetes sp.]